MPLVSHSTPRWIAVPVVITLIFLTISSLLLIILFLPLRELGKETAVTIWILLSSVLSFWIAAMGLRDHSRQAADARDSIPINGNSEHFGPYSYVPRSHLWTALSVPTPVGCLTVKGKGNPPRIEQEAIWNSVAPRMLEVVETAFTILFSPDPDHFRRAGFKLVPSRVIFLESGDCFKVYFSTVGFPSDLLLEPTVVFSSELKAIRADWNLEP